MQSPIFNEKCAKIERSERKREAQHLAFGQFSIHHRLKKRLPQHLTPSSSNS